MNSANNQTTLAPDPHLISIIKHLDKLDIFSQKNLVSILRRHPKHAKGYYSKNDLISAFKRHHRRLHLTTSPLIFADKLKKKPVRSISGVTPVSILTKPFPCPGKCIFCPSDIRMPKSYLSSEPGAQRATRNAFDPYLQTYNRLRAFKSNGHPTDKIELIILGGTWSYYPLEYQIWFIKRCFNALNDFGSNQDHRDRVKRASDFSKEKDDIDGSHLKQTYNQKVSSKLIKDIGGKLLNPWETATWTQLEKAQSINQTNPCRNVGLVIETRPDNISKAEVTRIRRLGCTKAQIGFQSLSDKVLSLNHRGHTVAATRRAMKLLRSAGFKIQAHWMPNLYGSDPAKDIADFKKIFTDPDFKPDELKIYPCSLIKSAELMKYHQQGKWQPYSHDELLKVLSTCIQNTPEYCRLTRVIRDIPSPDIVTGNKKTNFRQIAEQELDRLHIQRQDIRSREIKSTKFDPLRLKLKTTSYKTSSSTEKFLQFITPENRIVAFLRLSLPNVSFWSEAIESKQQKDHISRKTPSRMTKTNHFIPELSQSAIIREVHVYGTAANLGERSANKAQHLGLGKKLIARATSIAKKSGVKNLAVISAIGTREYYKNLGFTQGRLYQHIKLK